MSTKIATIDAMLELLASQLGREVIVELIQVYEDNSGLQLSKIEAAHKAGDHGVVKAQAHGMKSSSANMGAEDLAATCLKLEKSVALDAATAKLVESMRGEREEALKVMRAWASRS